MRREGTPRPVRHAAVHSEREREIKLEKVAERYCLLFIYFLSFYIVDEVVECCSLETAH